MIMQVTSHLLNLRTRFMTATSYIIQSIALLVNNAIDAIESPSAILTVVYLDYITDAVA